MYLGGDFTYIGPDTRGGAQFDTITNKTDRSFPKIKGVVYTSISDGAGGWYIGGSFTQVGGVKSMPPQERSMRVLIRM